MPLWLLFPLFYSCALVVPAAPIVFLFSAFFDFSARAADAGKGSWQPGHPTVPETKVALAGEEEPVS